MIRIKGYWKIASRRARQQVWVERVVEPGVTEPVTLAEVKSHARLDFSDDDSYIQNFLIPAARKQVENYCGVSLVETVVTVVVESMNRTFELPYGPYVDTLVIVDDDAVTIDEDDYELKGTDFPVLQNLATSNVTLTYNAGYTDENMPPDLKLAVLHQVTHLYEHRGDGSLSPMATQLAKPYKKTVWGLT